MNGFDFSKPVSIGMIGSGIKLWQYRVPEQQQGNWYSPTPKVKATELGINPKGEYPKTGIEINKVLNEYQTAQQVEVLRGTVAPACK